MSLIDAETALENDEIDSLCFFRYRDLLLQPVHPQREGWRRIRELSYELEGQQFPTIEDLNNLPDTLKKEILLDQFPWLIPFTSLFELTLMETPLPIQGTFSTTLSSGFVDSTTATNIRASFFTVKSHSGGELTLRGSGDSLSLYRRSVTIGSRNGNLRLFGGNISPIKRDLLWGRYESGSERRDIGESILFGEVSGWNGIWGEINRNRFSAIAGAHFSENQQLATIISTFELNILNLQTGVVTQNSEYQENLFTIALTDSGNQFRIETDFSDRGGVGIITSATRSGDDGRGEIELWYLSSQYNPIMSRRIHQLDYRYDRDSSSVIGVRSRVRRDGLILNIDLNFTGELLTEGGREDLAITLFSAQHRKWWSVKNRFYEFENNRTHQRLWAITGKTVPMIRRIELPLRVSNTMEWGEWKRSSIVGGVRFKNSGNSYEILSYYRTYATGTEHLYLRLSLKQKLNEFGRASLSLEIPLDHTNEIELYGKVEFFF